MRLSNYLDNAMSMQYFASFKCFINFDIVVNHGLLYTWTGFSSFDFLIELILFGTFYTIYHPIIEKSMSYLMDDFFHANAPFNSIKRRPKVTQSVVHTRSNA